MSKETMNWLNTNTLIGFTTKRGNAWHYRAEEQGEQTNHYPGAIPTDDVRSRVFNFQMLEGDASSAVVTPEGVTTFHDPTRKTYIHPRTGEFMGVFKRGHKAHDYEQWLLDNCSVIMDNSDLQVASAGLLRGGAVAWVQYELEESTTVAGLEFRPFLTAATSFDGSLSSTYVHGSQAVVCDNTLAGALTETRVKVRHSSRSLDNIEAVRAALGLFIPTADAMVAQIDRLSRVKVSERIWAKFLDDAAIAPLVDKTGKALQGKAKTFAEIKRSQMTNLWTSDERAAQWHGTALGAYMAHNTWEQHFQNVRNISRAERNALNMAEGKVAAADAATMAALSRLVTI
jgi:phage/plasmid-like protein (TIGR03299 family)